jgi:hypothetical protein
VILVAANFSLNRELNPENSLIDAYCSQDFDNLSKNLDSADNRIKFEEWLKSNFSPEAAIESDLAWRNKVITLLCTKSVQDGKETIHHRKHEDLLLASLFFKVIPLPKKNETLLLNKPVHSLKAMLNLWQILSEIKNDILPSTSEVLFKMIKEKAIQDPEEFEQWFHLMGKDLKQFQDSYPELLTENKFNLLMHAFNFGANSNAYSTEAKLERIKKGLPTFINAGFSTHAVTLLVWNDQFIICNRGNATRRPI